MPFSRQTERGDDPFKIAHSTCTTCGSRFTRLNLAINVGLAVLKISVGLLTGSRALLTNSLYSLNDVLSAIAVLISVKVARAPADKEHPFGRGKVEFVGIGLISMVLVASVLLLVWSLIGITSEAVEMPFEVMLAAFLVAGLSFGVSHLLSKRGHCAAKRLRSPSLHTSAEHNHADATASVAVMVAIAGSVLFKLHILDRLVSIFEALDIMRLSGVLLALSIKGLMDSALPPEDVEVVRRACGKIDGVSSVKVVRSRRVGAQAWVDVIVGVRAGQSVEDAHGITRRVRAVVGEALGPLAKTQVGFRVDANGRTGPVGTTEGALDGQ
jgi:cation diffusion facilitator family transporter